LALYRQYLDHQDSSVFVSKVSAIYVQGALERLAVHPTCQVRRGAVLALGLLGNYEANPAMGRALQDNDRTVRRLAENGIRNVWIRAGNAQQQQQLSTLIRLNTARHYEEAVQKARQLIEKTPWLAEAWNQRAVAFFGLGRYAESIRDCHQALEINPYHFAAASGMGQAYLQLNNPVLALECFRRALSLNRDLEAVRSQVDRLARMIQGKQQG
jgi:tetratricopeptide (TPR) repeat protein